MIERDFEVAKEWLVQTLQEIRDGGFHSSMFKITKSLRGYYKNPQQIAHKVLADRMAERDPGNKPQSNERVPYCYIDPCNIKCTICKTKINPKNYPTLVL